MIPVFSARVLEGPRLALDRQHDYARYLQGLAGQVVEVIVRRPRTRRSLRELRYWFGVPMMLLSEQTGYTKLQMHYLCLTLCFGFVIDPTTGREVPVVPASRALSTAQMSEAIEWCPPWAWETYQLQIPLPNEVDWASLPGGSEIREEA